MCVIQVLEETKCSHTTNGMSTRALDKLNEKLGVDKRVNRMLEQHVIHIDTRDPDVIPFESGSDAFAFTAPVPQLLRNVVYVELVYIVAPSMKLSDIDGYVMFSCPELFGDDPLYIPFQYGFWHLNNHLAFPLRLAKGVYCKNLLTNPLTAVRRLTVSMRRSSGAIIQNTDIESPMARPYTALAFNVYTVPRLETLNLLRRPTNAHYLFRERYRMILADSKQDAMFATTDVYKFRVPLMERLHRPKSLRLLSCAFPPLGQAGDVSMNLSHVEVHLPQLGAEWPVQNCYFASSEDVVWLQTDPLHVHNVETDWVTLEYLNVEVYCMRVTNIGPPATYSKTPLLRNDTAGKKQCTLILHVTEDSGLSDSAVCDC